MSTKPVISVIISARNEEKHIVDTLKLIMQDSEALVDGYGKILVTWQSKEEGKRRFFIRK
mgnify:CR=1 FL=1